MDIRTKMWKDANTVYIYMLNKCTVEILNGIVVNLWYMILKIIWPALVKKHNLNNNNNNTLDLNITRSVQTSGSCSKHIKKQANRNQKNK